MLILTLYSVVRSLVIESYVNSRYPGSSGHRQNKISFECLFRSLEQTLWLRRYQGLCHGPCMTRGSLVHKLLTRGPSGGVRDVGDPPMNKEGHSTILRSYKSSP